MLRRETHRHCTGWLFSWFIIINHCNDSFIPLVLTFVSGKICAAVFTASCFDIYPELFFLPSREKDSNKLLLQRNTSENNNRTISAGSQ